MGQRGRQREREREREREGEREECLVCWQFLGNYSHFATAVFYTCFFSLLLQDNKINSESKINSSVMKQAPIACSGCLVQDRIQYLSKNNVLFHSSKHLLRTNWALYWVHSILLHTLLQYNSKNFVYWKQFQFLWHCASSTNMILAGRYKFMSP